jgi:energy-coupling factor transport system permease protein
LVPEISIILYVVFSITLFIFDSLTAYSIIFLILCLLFLKIPFRVLKSGWLPITLFLAFTFLSNVVNRHGKILFSTGFLVITDEGIHTASIKSLRVLFMIAGAKIMMALSKPDDIIRGLGRLLYPLENIGIPVKDFFHTMGLTVKCFPVLKNMAVEAYRENVKTADLKGFWDRARMVSLFLLPLFVKSIQYPEVFFEKSSEVNGQQS